MLKMTIDNEEVVSDKDITINEEMLSASSTILNNVYPKEWEEDKDYTSRFYYPQDYSKALIQRSYVTQEAEAGTTIQVNGSVTLNDVDTTKNSRVLRLLGQTSQAGTPTPSSPIPVNVVSGDNEIQVCGKNKLSPTLNDINEIISGVKREGTNGTYTLSGTATAGGGGNDKYTLTNTYTIQNGDYLHLCNSTTNTNSTIMIFNENNTQINNWAFNSINRVINISSYAGQKIKSIGFYNNSSFSGSITTSPMIINSNTVTNFEPYIGNTYNIDLPSGMELCKIGNYQDYIYKDSDKWYLHKEIGKYNIDTSTLGIKNNYTNIEYATIPKPNNYLGYGSFDKVEIICKSASHIAQAPSGWNDANLVNKISGNPEANRWWLGFSKGTGITAIRNALNGSYIYYPLATPTNTEITYEPLIEQLNALSSQ